ncbi:hypothetical protein [Streptomyces sp. NPDC001781]
MSGRAGSARSAWWAGRDPVVDGHGRRASGPRRITGVPRENVEVDFEGVQADLLKGVLTVRLPRSRKAGRRPIEIRS